jgi:hypothetical protein
MRWGTKLCFRQKDLYTTRFKDWQSTDVEQLFFGDIDVRGRSAVAYFADFTHPSVDGDAFSNLMVYLTVQKLRTPKGLQQLAQLTRVDNKNAVLAALQMLRTLYAAIWTESVWSIADASESAVKFLISDHPVTIYNSRCFPGSTYCRGYSDPDIRMTGSHTIFPLDLNKVLILTNLSWVRNPYANPLTFRPNPTLLRDAMFNFQTIQTHRMLAEDEVREINFVIKERAFRYVAAADKDWLYPEQHVRSSWDKLGRGYLFMPDPRSVDFTTEIMVGYGGGHSDAWDAYGKRPGDPQFRSESGDGSEWISFHAFQGELARVFGPRRRGRAFRFAKLEPEVDSAEFHAYHLGLEASKPRDRATHRGSKRRRKR